VHNFIGQLRVQRAASSNHVCEQCIGMELHGAGVPALPATAVAAFAKVSLSLSAFTPGLTEKTAAFLKLSPSGKV
jgi:hypothetical protein